MGADADQGALRVSIGPTTGEEAVDRFLAVFAAVDARRRARAGTMESAA